MCVLVLQQNHVAFLYQWKKISNAFSVYMVCNLKCRVTMIRKPFVKIKFEILRKKRVFPIEEEVEESSQHELEKLM